MILFKPLKKLCMTLRKSGGRNLKGNITVYNRGGGFKRKYRIIDFYRIYFINRIALVLRIEYDPNRNSYIALINYLEMALSYIISPQKLDYGTMIGTFIERERRFNIGSTFKIKVIPSGTYLHNVELIPKQGGKLAKSAGARLQKLRVTGKFTLVKQKSGEMRYILSECLATVGIVSTHFFLRSYFEKAGQLRNRGFKPKVRGVAQNPVSHPHGGGEGKSSGGRPSVTPWGFLTKGISTRSPQKKRLNKNIMKTRRSLKKYSKSKTKSLKKKAFLRKLKEEKRLKLK